LEYKITNISPDNILVESLTLQFEPDTDSASNYVDVDTTFRLEAGETTKVTAKVRPTPLFLANTNQLQMRFKYRVTSAGRIGELTAETHKGFYLIVDTPAADCGSVFISFKQPEDQRLANILERYARRAGFVPHLFVRSPEVGADQWKTIERMIRASHSVFILWGRRTEWGEGVEREIELCRMHHVREVLLIEHRVDIPTAFGHTPITFKRFDRQEPAEDLSAAVVSLHDQLKGSSR
jgi:hypothetical protein